MAIQIQRICFSPTGTTRRVLDAIAEGMQATIASQVDLTFEDALEPSTSENGIALIGVPVYSGRVPATAVERLYRHVEGTGRKAVLVVVYGNRAYEDALLELKLLTEKLGFIPCFGAAFIGEHSFSNEAKPIAPNRPDAQDLEKAREFGKIVAEKFTSGTESELIVPGNIPHRAGASSLGVTPEVILSDCTLCGECLSVCPTSAISVEEGVITTNQASCIWCCACLRGCPTNARVATAERIEQIRDFLYTQHSERKEPELFC